MQKFIFLALALAGTVQAAEQDIRPGQTYSIDRAINATLEGCQSEGADMTCTFILNAPKANASKTFFVDNFKATFANGQTIEAALGQFNGQTAKARVGAELKMGLNYPLSITFKNVPAGQNSIYALETYGQNSIGGNRLLTYRMKNVPIVRVGSGSAPAGPTVNWSGELYTLLGVNCESAGTSANCRVHLYGQGSEVKEVQGVAIYSSVTLDMPNIEVKNGQAVDIPVVGEVSGPVTLR